MVQAASEADKRAGPARLSKEATVRACGDLHDLLDAEGVDHEGG